MSEPIIKVHKLGKRYRIGAKIDPKGRDNFRDAILNTLKAPFTNLKRLRKLTNFEDENTDTAKDIIWALKDVSFEINKGEVVGIIGRNGSGKSTLLKILSRITEPTEGYAELRGRVASLLEVGTGFHRELTGRENIYLNGSILGMKKWEIDARFDEIVAFSEIEKFLDTPVKHYSSGMYVRLAFAVAAHLNPDILLVDEVLAVGDATFQKKCVGKMDEIAKGGRTVLFVSHNMGAIRGLCKKGILLDKGKNIVNDSIEKVVSCYIGYDKKTTFHYIGASKRTNTPYLKEITIMQNNNTDALAIDKPISIMFDIEMCSQKNLVVSIAIYNEQGICVHHSSDEFNNLKTNLESSVRICEIPSYALSEGKYYLHTGLGIRNVEFFQEIQNALVFNVKFDGALADRTTAKEWKGMCGPGLIKWFIK